MNIYEKNELLLENEKLRNEVSKLQEQKDAYQKKSEYLSKELKKYEKGNGHMSTLEIITDLALTICVALLFTIVSYTSTAHGEGFFTLIKNAFSMLFQ